MASTAPVFGSALVPTSIRVLIVISVCVALCPILSAPVSATLEPIGYVGLLLSEAVLGLSIGVGAKLLLEALSFAGQLLDIQIGLSAAAFYDPTVGGQSSLLGQLHSLVGTVLFLQLGGHHWLLQGLAGSFKRLPVAACSLPRPELAALVVGLGTSVFHLALQIAAPVMLVLLMMDVVFALIGRVVPQMNVFLVEIPAKLLVGLAALMLCAPLLGGIVWSLIEEMNHYLALPGG
jgi:flagellar biosynthesis protein FliR